MNLNAAQRFIIVLQIVDGYCTRLLPVSCVGTGIKKNFRMILFFQEPFTLITVKNGKSASRRLMMADGWDTPAMN